MQSAAVDGQGGKDDIQGSSFSSSPSSILAPSLPPLPLIPGPNTTTHNNNPDGQPGKRKRGGNRKGSSNWKRREQNVLLDLLEVVPKFPSKLDDWNALCVQFNERTVLLGFPPREGKSLRKKWQVLISSKGQEGEGLNEQEMRAKKLAQGSEGVWGKDWSKSSDLKRQRVGEGNSAFVSSSPLAPLPLTLPGPSSSSGESTSSSAPSLVVGLTKETVGGAIRSLRALLSSRQAEFERREYVWAEWRRKDIEEREKTREVLEALVSMDEEDAKTAAAGGKKK